MITEQQKQALKDKGYSIENMQEVWGDGWWNGLFRWMNDKQLGDGFGVPQISEEEAWADALQFEAQWPVE